MHLVKCFKRYYSRVVVVVVSPVVDVALGKRHTVLSVRVVGRYIQCMFVFNLTCRVPTRA